MTADALEEDGLPIAYGGELKIWSGEKDFLAAVAQELDNCTSYTSDGVLVIIIRDRTSFSEMRDVAIAAMDAAYERLESVAGQATFRVPRPADPKHMVRLVVTFVDETRSEAHLAKPKAS